MLKKLKSNNQGFTIIEIMIVLVIAALILLIVFLAVPALERNARNTQRKNDAAGILAGVNEFINNNGGQATNLATCNGTGTITWGSSAQTQSQTKVGIYTGGCSAAGSITNTQSKVFIDTTVVPPTGVAALTPSATNDAVDIYLGGSCDATTTGKVDAAAANSVAIVYELETGSGNYGVQCQDE